MSSGETLDDGMACSWNWQCTNNACGRATNTTVKECCPSGKVYSYLGFDYCANYNDGVACTFDGQCKSDHCNNNHTCGSQPDGTACDSHADCNNKSCGREHNSAAKACCGTGQTTSVLGSAYCSGYEGGNACKYGQQCKSSTCNVQNVCECNDSTKKLCSTFWCGDAKKECKSIPLT